MEATRIALRAPRLVDPAFYVEHNRLVGLRDRSGAAIRLHFGLRGQWRRHDPSASFATEFAASELARHQVPLRGSPWTTFLAARGAARARFHPLQVAESSGFDFPLAGPTPLAQLASGMELADARSHVHPALAGPGPVREPDVAALYDAVAAARAGRAPAPERSVDVLFVNGDQHCPACTQYRVLNPLEAVRAAGYDALAVDATDLHNLAGTRLRARLVVVFRGLWDEELADFLAALRADGAALVFDIDDLLFDGPRVLGSLQPGSSVTEDLDLGTDRATTRASMWRTAALCDGATFPTELLAAVWRRADDDRPATVLPSFLSGAQIEIADRVASRGDEDAGKVVVGYSAGTATHARDFASVAPALATLMQRHAQVELQVLGPLALTEHEVLAPFARRIVHRPSVTSRWDQLMERIHRFDVNIVPLEVDNGYCQAKSEVKYLEAGAVGVPTVASATPAYRRAIGADLRGIVVERPSGWLEALERLVVDTGARRQLGARAREDVAARYGATGEFGRRYVGRVDAWLSGRSLDDGAAHDPLSAIFAPRIGLEVPDGRLVLLIVGEPTATSATLAEARSLAGERWPGVHVAAVAAADDGADGLAPTDLDVWRPGDSEVDLATALRSASAGILVGVVGEIAALAERCGLRLYSASAGSGSPSLSSASGAGRDDSAPGRDS